MIQIRKRIVIDEDFIFDEDGNQVITDEDTSHSVEETLRRIAEMIEEGYTSGYEPHWYIEEVHNEQVEDKL